MYQNGQRLFKLTPAHRQKILERDGYLCIYCLDEATEVDHILPYSYKAINQDWNLVASCRRCNGIASNKVFFTFDEKWYYIKCVREGKRTKAHTYKRAICPDCLRTFRPLYKGATILLCRDCAVLANLPPEERMPIIEDLKRNRINELLSEIETFREY